VSGQKPLAFDPPSPVESVLLVQRKAMLVAAMHSTRALHARLHASVTERAEALPVVDVPEQHGVTIMLDDMIDLCSRRCAALLQAEYTERVFRQVAAC